MKVLVACEESQAVCIAFRERGHEAYSCDLQECSGEHPEWHIQGDVKDIIYRDWDLIVAHPPCTYLCNSGVRWLFNKEGLKNSDRWTAMFDASRFFNLFTSITWCPVAIENPIPHKYAALPKYSQIIQPWQFGHGESKATCLWLYNLPLLKPTDIVEGREQRVWKMTPGENRAKERSKTYQGIAKAMAEQWG